MPFALKRGGRVATLAFALLALTACGGGDEDPLPSDSSGDVVAKYIGSWRSACYDDSGASAHLRADFTKTSATGFSGEVVAYAYLGTSCSGPSVRSKKVLTNMSVNYAGTKTVGGVSADKFNGTADQGSAKLVLRVDGGTLQIGDPDAAKDGEGFPEAFYDKTLSRL